MTENNNTEANIKPEKPIETKPAGPPPLKDKSYPKQKEVKVKEEVKPELIKEPITLTLLIQQLLKTPQNVTHSIRCGSSLPWLPLCLFTLSAFALFGLILGMFSGGDQLWHAPLKIAGGILFAATICLPSLFIFSCLSKIESNFKSIIGILVCAICISALLLLGFIPVLWLFSTTSGSLAFFGFLALATWLICLCLGINFISKSAKHLGATQTTPLHIWFVIFTLVTLQMPTSLRPIVGETQKDFVNFKDKKFFLIHWGESMVEPSDHPQEGHIKHTR